MTEQTVTKIAVIDEPHPADRWLFRISLAMLIGLGVIATGQGHAQAVGMFLLLILAFEIVGTIRRRRSNR